MHTGAQWTEKGKVGILQEIDRCMTIVVDK